MLPGEKVTRLRFLNGQSKWVDLLLGLDLHVLDQAAQLGDRGLLLVDCLYLQKSYDLDLGHGP